MGQIPALLPCLGVFWACYAEEGTKVSTNPFDRVNLDCNSLFWLETLFYHLQPSRNVSLVQTVSVLASNFGAAAWVEVGILGAVMLGFSWVC